MGNEKVEKVSYSSEFVQAVRSKATKKEREDAEALETEEIDLEMPDEPEKYTGVIDLSDERLYNPQKEKYKNREVGQRNYNFVSIYMKKSELEYLDKLAKKYKTSRANIVRMLIVNSR